MGVGLEINTGLISESPTAFRVRHGRGGLVGKPATEQDGWHSPGVWTSLSSAGINTTTPCTPLVSLHRIQGQAGGDRVSITSGWGGGSSLCIGGVGRTSRVDWYRVEGGGLRGVAYITQQIMYAISGTRTGHGYSRTSCYHFCWSPMALFTSVGVLF